MRREGSYSNRPKGHLELDNDNEAFSRAIGHTKSRHQNPRTSKKWGSFQKPISDFKKLFVERESRSRLILGLYEKEVGEWKKIQDFIRFINRREEIFKEKCILDKTGKSIVPTIEIIFKMLFFY